ncbi:hypothetical protein BJY59DRAFT_16843 [Rhodotorula toruloides]
MIRRSHTLPPLPDFRQLFESAAKTPNSTSDPPVSRDSRRFHLLRPSTRHVFRPSPTRSHCRTTCRTEHSDTEISNERHLIGYIGRRRRLRLRDGKCG